MELEPSDRSSAQNENFVNVSNKLLRISNGYFPKEIKSLVLSILFLTVKFQRVKTYCKGLLYRMVT